MEKCIDNLYDYAGTRALGSIGAIRVLHRAAKIPSI